METLTKTTLFDVEFFIIEDDQKANYGPEITDLLMDSYNHQVRLGDTFRGKMQMLIDGMEFAYPNDPQKLREVINEFADSAQASLVDYMKKTLDLHTRHSYAESDSLRPMSNAEWMRHMSEQLVILKGYELNPQPGDEEGFYYYEA